jgi:hypothetical protein
LPYPPTTYDAQSFEEFNKILRIYFNQLDNALRNAMATTVPYELQVSQGQIAGATSFYKFGFNPDINGTEETIWTQGGNVPWPTTAFTAYIVSDDAADSGTSTGAQTVQVEGLDADYNIKSVSVTLNGTTEVAISGTWIRINRAFVTLSGTGGTAAGTINIQSSGGGVIYANLGIGNQTQMAAYTVPAGYTLYLDDVSFTAALGIQSKNVTVKFVLRNFGTNTFRTGIIETVQSNSLLVPFPYPFAIAEKTDVECRAFSDTTNVEVSASFQGVLIKN